MTHNRKLGILVGGGPAPGINSVIGAATIRARLDGVEVLGIDGKQVTREQLAKVASAVRARTNDAITYLKLDASSLPGRMARLAGSEGWWLAS